MNRREFCQASALLLAGSVCAGVSVRSEECTTRFRAKKIFLESWESENVWMDSPRTASFVRNKLESIRRSGCNGLLLVPGSHAVSRWIEKIVSEANRFDLKVFVPAYLGSDCFRKARTSISLSYESGILQAIDGRPADNGGFLLGDGANDLLGLVLYDSSRCLWTGFTPYSSGLVQDPEYSVNDSRLIAARWLDDAFSSRRI